jgi:hypothetical protein
MQITKTMEQSPWEANSSSAASLEVTHFLLNMKVHHVHKSLLLVLILRKINPVHTFPYFTPLSTPWSSKGSLPFRFSKQNMQMVY